jgi:hypothetical protein
MKITIIQAAAKKPTGVCPVYIDDWPVNQK